MSPLEPKTVKLYLLGQLDKASREQIEESLLTSAILFDEISIAEDELTDQYLANELSEEERRSFETHFLATDERRKKLRFARTFKRYVGRAAESQLQDNRTLALEPDEGPVKPIAKKRGLLSFLPLQNPIVAYSLAAAVLSAVIGISWLVFHNLSRAPLGSGKVLVVSLAPGLTRQDGETKSVSIAADTESVQLNLELTTAEYQSYRTELLTAELASLLVKEDLKPESVAGKKTINFTIPAELLKRNDYRIRLSGRTAAGTYEPLSSYTFRVIQ